MHSSPQPYVGITGITMTDEVDALVEAFQKADLKPDAQHTGMLGFLVAKEMAQNKPPLSPRRVKDRDTLVRLAECVDGDALSVVHYECKDEPHFADSLIPLLKDLYEGKLCKTVQLNTTPTPTEVIRLLSVYPDLRLIYQIRPALMKEGMPTVIAQIQRHRDAFQYALIDPSCGQGVEGDVGEAIALRNRLKECMPEMTVGFAGGYSCYNVRRRTYELIMKMHRNDFCLDAEGSFRDRDDRLVLSRAETYIHEAAEGLKLVYL